VKHCDHRGHIDQLLCTEGCFSFAVQLVGWPVVDEELPSNALGRLLSLGELVRKTA
jgi:hypothetical protein